MIVAQMLKGKGDQVVTIRPDDTIAAAAKLLAQHRIGAIVVSPGDGTIAGILSERDIVRHLAQSGAKALDLPVGDVMTAKVVTCRANDRINDLMGMMSQGRFRHIPVVEQARMIGIISIGDVVKARVAEIESEAQALRDYITTG